MFVRIHLLEVLIRILRIPKPMYLDLPGHILSKQDNLGMRLMQPEMHELHE